MPDLARPTTLGTVSEPVIPPLHHDLVFHGPLSEARADALISGLGPLDGKHVVDLGCGWAELLLRAVAAGTGATGHGIDLDPGAIARARANAATRALPVTFTTTDASTWHGEADVLIINGATHIWGGEPATHTANALRAARDLLTPNGRLLLGEGFWHTTPTPARLAAMPIPRDQYGSLPALVDLALAHGYRPLRLCQATLDEWDAFQSGHALGWERWLEANPDSPHRAAVTAKADTHRAHWLHGWREALGFAYLTLRSP